MMKFTPSVSASRHRLFDLPPNWVRPPPFVSPTTAPPSSPIIRRRWPPWPGGRWVWIVIREGRYGVIAIRPSGGQPPAGLSAARGVGHPKGVFWCFQLLWISNNISTHCPSDAGTPTQRRVPTKTVCRCRPTSTPSTPPPPSRSKSSPNSRTRRVPRKGRPCWQITLQLK
jgi:hypothetical protein